MQLYLRTWAAFRQLRYGNNPTTLSGASCRYVVRMYVFSHPLRPTYCTTSRAQHADFTVVSANVDKTSIFLLYDSLQPPNQLPLINPSKGSAERLKLIKYEDSHSSSRDDIEREIR